MEVKIINGVKTIFPESEKITMQKMSDWLYNCLLNLSKENPKLLKTLEQDQATA